MGLHEEGEYRPAGQAAGRYAYIVQIYRIITEKVNDMARTNQGKRVKTKTYMNHSPCDGTLENGVLEWQVPDDIRVIGTQLVAEHSDASGARLAEISLKGTWGTDVDTADIEQETDAKILNYALHNNYGADHVQCIHSTIFYPEGYGVDVDEGEYIYVHQFGTAAGTGMTRATIFYVER